MRKSTPAAFLATIVVTLLALNLTAAPDNIAKLKQADQDWAKAVAARSVDQFMTFIGDDAYMSDLTGKWMHGREAIKADWIKALANPDFKLNWTVESADVSKDGNLGYTRGTFQGTDSGKPISGTYTTVWKKEKTGKWRVAVDIAGAASEQ